MMIFHGGVCALAMGKATNETVILSIIIKAIAQDGLILNLAFLVRLMDVSEFLPSVFAYFYEIFLIKQSETIIKVLWKNRYPRHST